MDSAAELKLRKEIEAAGQLNSEQALWANFSNVWYWPVSQVCGTNIKGLFIPKVLVDNAQASEYKINN